MSFELKGFSRIKDTLTGQPTPPPSPESVEGRVIAGRFEVIREIGKGGMGLVYLARQTSMDRAVAVKVLSPDQTCDGDARARFRQEAAAVSRLKDPHTVSVFDFGEDLGGELFLVMELLEGRPLSKVLKELGPFDAQQVVDIADQVLDSLAEAHAAGILHRDLKPDNIFVRESSNDKLFVKVLDFGLAKMMNAKADFRSFPGVVFGTPAYMSPEQVLGHDLDERSDLYSVAVIMFEMLTGALPVKGKTALELGVRKTRLQPQRLDEANPGIEYPPGARAFFEHTLSLNPVNRPATTEEFRNLMAKSFDRKSAAGRGGRRSIPDIYHAQKTLPEHGAPFNRDSPAAPPVAEKSASGRHSVTSSSKSGATTNRRTRPGPVLEKHDTLETKFIDEALKRETPRPRPAPKPTIKAGAGIPGDRRKARRGPRLTTVKCCYNSEDYQATATDISGTGAFISSSWLPVKGHRITLLFKYPGARDYAVSILAEVTRVSLGSDGPLDVRGFGVSWLKLRAVGEIETVYKFLNETLGIQRRPEAPASVTNNQWEFIFDNGALA